ncbi:MAG: sulfotransferase domain-containing protein [Psychroserpens sp.]|uniref:sulfotransferase domain-containing protein n=1 Tax=Psychroserpens sp. TaxID=2020870 RepID=UPI00300305FD
MDEETYTMIIGAMKAGTTTLFEHLRNHPEICASTKKETEYFLDKDDIVHNLDDYNGLFQYDKSKHRVKMEASTGYAKYPKHKDVSKRIFDLGLKPKFIFIVRHPIDRINSEINFWRNYPQWSHPKDNLDQMILRSSYYLQLSQYEGFFSKEDILILDFDDLKKRPQELINASCQFLGIDSYEIKKVDKVSNKTEMKSDLELQIIKRYSTLLKWFPVSFKEKVKQMVRGVSKTSNWELTSSEVKMVKQQLEGDMHLFQKTYNYDTSKWGFSK